MIFLQINVPAQQTLTAPQKFMKLVDYPSCSPDLAPSNYSFIRFKEFLKGKKFMTNNEEAGCDGVLCKFKKSIF